MSLIIHMNIPGAIVVASDRRVVGTSLDGPSQYGYVKTDCEQKSILVNNRFAVSYCGNANINGYPTSFYLRETLKGAGGCETTFEVAEYLLTYLTMLDVATRPSLLIAGYNNGVQSILEVQRGGLSIVNHVVEYGVFGPTYHGDTSIMEAITSLQDFEYSLFRLKDAMDFCDLAITATARIQALRKNPQTVSAVYDMMVITDGAAEWITKG